VTDQKLSPKNSIFRYLPHAIIIGIAGFVLAQFGRFIIPEFKLDNPPIEQTINWDSPETERLWHTACADCHSNETVYPWYSYVAPVGWLVAHDTHEGREYLNVSVDGTVDLEEIIEKIEEGEMPLPIYTITHKDAILSDADQQALIDGLRVTFADMNESSDHDHDNHDDDDDNHDDDDDNHDDGNTDDDDDHSHDD